MNESAGSNSRRSPNISFDTGSLLLTAMIWLGSSGVSGIIGSASYDALKQILDRFHSRDKKTHMEEWEAMLCAKVALVMQCQAHNLPAPELNGLSVEMHQNSDSSWDVHLNNEGFVAYMKVPAGDPDKNPVEVNIIGWKALEDILRITSLVTAPAIPRRGVPVTCPIGQWTTGTHGR